MYTLFFNAEVGSISALKDLRCVNALISVGPGSTQSIEKKATGPAQATDR